MIKEGDYVIAKTDTFLRLVQVCKGRPLFLGKRKVSVGSTIGHPYGSFFDMKGNGDLTIKSAATRTELSVTNMSSDVKDNRSLVDSNSTQKLTTSDIETFKSEGISGEEIVRIIVENSSTFEEKSAFSQEKYLKKKQLKYMTVMQILQPNTRLLVESFYSYCPQKICNLRMDTLAQMLAFCNIMSGGKYIVVDGVLGLLTAAVLERIGKSGSVMHMLTSSSPPSVYRYAVDALNFSPEYLQDVLLVADLQHALNNIRNDACCDTISEDSMKQANSERKVLRQMTLKKVIDMLLPRDMDGLLYAGKHHPVCALPLLDYLAYSRPFVIHSMFPEPLIECYSLLKTRGDVILLNMSETWLRKYQVLPDRTHPEYGMSANGGFLLTGIRVEKKT